MTKEREERLLFEKPIDEKSRKLYRSTSTSKPLPTTCSDRIKDGSTSNHSDNIFWLYFVHYCPMTLVYISPLDRAITSSPLWRYSYGRFYPGLPTDPHTIFLPVLSHGLTSCLCEHTPGTSPSVPYKFPNLKIHPPSSLFYSQPSTLLRPHHVSDLEPVFLFKTLCKILSTPGTYPNSFLLLGLQTLVTIL